MRAPPNCRSSITILQFERCEEDSGEMWVRRKRIRAPQNLEENLEEGEHRHPLFSFHSHSSKCKITLDDLQFGVGTGILFPLPSLAQTAISL